MGKESVFVGGLRVTDQETLEIAQMVLVGKINAGIVSLIAKCGARGVGLSGSDGNLIIAKKMDKLTTLHRFTPARTDFLEHFFQRNK